ncbi:hypothetical protein [Oceanobacillus oncorhynchi]|uniref:hypothetical protein n=1 Tax=Oceanobacillus oncorhynchi TaxID=545501 RepID=UPI0025A3BC41|nr:hypothetical protein [Oceanobacillus oncorhynchi]MDM8100955.1 hypothetical protein [Oceanobacillus oncorhynchi]
MNEKEDILSDAELKDLQKQIADRSSKTAAKVGKLLEKGRDLTASDIKWLLGKEVRRQRIAKAMKMSISTFERYLTEHGLTTKERSEPVDMDKVKELIDSTDMSVKEISDSTGVSYSAVYYHYKQKEKEREDVTENLEKQYKDKIGKLEERTQDLKEELTRHQKAIETLKADRQKFAEELQEERSKVREREKMIEKLKFEQQLLKDTSKGDESLQKKHDLLLEYITAGGND